MKVVSERKFLSRKSGSNKYKKLALYDTCQTFYMKIK
jgi:hypothetical protein